MTTLVTGATGSVGSQVVRELLERGEPVRAFVRDARRAAGLLGDGVELAVGDFADADSVRRALAGSERLFLACGNVPGQVEYETGAIDAAAEAGIALVVKLSASAADPETPLLFPSWQGRIEEHLRASGLPAVVLRPTDYMTNLLAFAPAVAATGKLFAPARGLRTSFVHARDVGAAAAAALAEDGHEGETYVLTGPEAIGYDEVARALSQATGRPVEFVDVPDEAARQGLLEQGLPEPVADFVVELFAAQRDGLTAFTTDTVRELTGRDPRPLAEFAREHAAAFGAAAPAHAR